jgi:hypothetical protein
MPESRKIFFRINKMEWQEFLKKWRKKHSDIPYREALGMASKEYQEKKEKGSPVRKDSRRMNMKRSPVKKTDPRPNTFGASRDSSKGRSSVHVTSEPGRPLSKASEGVVLAGELGSEYTASELAAFRVAGLDLKDMVIDETRLKKKYSQVDGGKSVPEAVFRTKNGLVAIEAKAIPLTGYSPPDAGDTARKVRFRAKTSYATAVREGQVVRPYFIAVDNAVRALEYTKVGGGIKDNTFGPAPEQKINQFIMAFQVPEGTSPKKIKEIERDINDRLVNEHMRSLRTTYPDLFDNESPIKYIVHPVGKAILRLDEDRGGGYR